jgi:hypothetical protein
MLTATKWAMGILELGDSDVRRRIAQGSRVLHEVALHD